MVEDVKHELEDAAQDGQKAVSERFRKAKMKKEVRRGSVEVRCGVPTDVMRGPALDSYEESEASGVCGI